MSTTIRIPRAHAKRLKAFDNLPDVNRWGSDVDARIVEILQCLGDTQRAIRDITRTTGAASIGLHAINHRPATGIDPLATAAPISILGGTSSNSVGVGNSFARNDHSHDVGTAAWSGSYSASAASEGTGNPLLRADGVLLAPTFLRTAFSASSITATDDGTDQTFTGGLGALNLRSASGSLSLPDWTGGGSNPAVVGEVLGFTASSNTIGTSLRTGIHSIVSYGDSSTYSSATFRSIFSEIRTSGTNSPTYINVSCINIDQTTSNISLTAGTHTFTKRTGILVHPSFVTQSGSGAITVTDYFGIEMATWPVIGNPGTVTNARAAHITMPTLGATIRRGVHLVTSTSNVGTEAANVEGFYCEDITRGTARRASFYAEGATNSTPTDVYAFYQGTAHTVGTNRYGFRATGATTGTPTLCVGFYADGHSVGTTQWAFFAAADESYFSGTQMDDNMKHVLGTGRDAEIYYDGTELIIDPDVVGSGHVYFKGPTRMDDNVLMKFGTGNDATITYDGTDMLIDPDLVGGGECRVTGKLHTTGELEVDGALNHDGTTVGVFNTAPATQQTVTGSRGGNAALASLLTALALYGIIVDGSTA